MKVQTKAMPLYKIVLIVIVLVGGAYFIGNKYNKVEYKVDDKQITVSSKSELEKIMEEENFKKITILRARKVANDNKKDIEIERNKKAIDIIESEYESIRAEEIALVGNNDVVLK